MNRSKTIDELLIEAQVKKLWFYCRYNNWWIPPGEIKTRLNERPGLKKFQWELRPPQVLLKRLEDEIKDRQKQIDYIKTQIEIRI